MQALQEGLLTTVHAQKNTSAFSSLHCMQDEGERVEQINQFLHSTEDAGPSPIMILTAIVTK